MASIRIADENRTLDDAAEVTRVPRVAGHRARALDAVASAAATRRTAEDVLAAYAPEIDAPEGHAAAT